VHVVTGSLLFMSADEPGGHAQRPSAAEIARTKAGVVMGNGSYYASQTPVTDVGPDGMPIHGRLDVEEHTSVTKGGDEPGRRALQKLSVWDREEEPVEIVELFPWSHPYSIFVVGVLGRDERVVHRRLDAELTKLLHDGKDFRIAKVGYVLFERRCALPRYPRGQGMQTVFVSPYTRISQNE
jgi:hypothetical protein